MINRTDVIVALAESEVIRGPLNNWQKFKLPEPNEKIDALLEQLGLDRVEDPDEETDRSEKGAKSGRTGKHIPYDGSKR